MNTKTNLRFPNEHNLKPNHRKESAIQFIKRFLILHIFKSRVYLLFQVVKFNRIKCLELHKKSESHTELIFSVVSEPGLFNVLLSVFVNFHYNQSDR
jgi:hypothetical protein